ncbi:Asx homology domain-containing protein [Sphaerosporella brunnea]|uniref:Asx homology domain-containing protein n=1 Tax=Sphaerosporella brunnea TaxID=1250544 RepID=A0A5J5EMQ4_9PEZI|nr:Asx homology domain-containing protein [Sphaerosporella brunnea]
MAGTHSRASQPPRQEIPLKRSASPTGEDAPPSSSLSTTTENDQSSGNASKKTRLGDESTDNKQDATKMTTEPEQPDTAIKLEADQSNTAIKLEPELTEPMTSPKKAPVAKKGRATRKATPSRGKARNTKSKAQDEGDNSNGEKTSEAVSIPPERRSARVRAPPKDPYVEGLVAEAEAKKILQSSKDVPPSKAAPPSKAPASNRGSGGKKKRLTEAQLWSLQNVSTETSPFVNTDISKLLNEGVVSRENLGDEGYDALIAFLPADWIIYPVQDSISVADQKPLIDPSVFNSPYIKEAMRRYQEDLGAGYYSEEYLARAENARRRRVAGEFDDWKDRNFEVQWGQHQRIYHGAIAAESSKIKLQELIKNNQFRVGDVFSLRRTFIGTSEIRKDATLIALDTETGTLSFRYPPGKAEWSREGVEDRVANAVASLNAFEALLLKEDGRAPERIPHGNAWKSLRVIRKGEDIGCIFDLRVKYYHQHYAINK